MATDSPEPRDLLAAMLHNFDPAWCRHGDGDTFGECDARAKALLAAGVSLASVPTDVLGLRAAKEALFAASMEVSWMDRPVAECWALIDAVALAASQPIPTEPRCTCSTNCHFDCAGCGCTFHVPTEPEHRHDYVPLVMDGMVVERRCACGAEPLDELLNATLIVEPVPTEPEEADRG